MLQYLMLLCDQAVLRPAYISSRGSPPLVSVARFCMRRQLMTCSACTSQGLLFSQGLLVHAVQAAFQISHAPEQDGLLIARFEALAQLLDQVVVSRVLRRMMDARAPEISADLSATMAKWHSNPGKVCCNSGDQQKHR